MEQDSLRSRSLRERIAHKHHARLRHLVEQILARGQFRCHLLRLIALLQRLATHIIDLAQHKVGIREPICSPLGKLCQRHPADIGTVDIGDDIHLLQSLVRELARQFKATNRLYLVVEKVQSERFALRIGEYIEDTASHRVLTRLIDKINLFEAQLPDSLLQVGNFDAVASAQMQRLRHQALHIGNSLRQRLGVGRNNDKLILAIFQSIEHPRAHHHALCLLCTIDNGAFVGRWKEQNSLLAQQCVEVVQCVCCGIPILAHDDMHTALASDGCRHIK